MATLSGTGVAAGSVPAPPTGAIPVRATDDLRALVGHAPVNLAGACALVLNSADEVLLQRRRDTGGWGTPGGIAELGEALEDTLRRELHEETGLRCPNLRLLPLDTGLVGGPEFWHRYPNGDEVYLVGLRTEGTVPAAALDSAFAAGLAAGRGAKKAS